MKSSDAKTHVVKVVIVAAALLALPTFLPAQSAPPPWNRTEARDGCADFNLLRNHYFGDTHVHTALSMDAVSGGIITEPRDAYDFALGLPIGLPPYDGETPLRTAQLRRPLDFTVITDHAEFYGEVEVCLTEGLPGYDSEMCQQYRDNIPQNDPSAGGFAFFVAPYQVEEQPVRHAFCGPADEYCLTQASLIWQDTQAAAEEHYDRTAACTFTSFIGYEWTRSPNVENLHRNVVFRNNVVPAMPATCVEEPTVQGLWAALQSQCIDGLAGCDALVIPHNSNLSNGSMFVPENADGTALTAEDALIRAAMEPLVEITQHKGESECRTGVLTNDELCSFEKMSTVLIGVPSGSGVTYDPRLFVRNVLKEGLEIEESLGANPFRLGFIGSTDTHGSTPGLVDEEDYGTAGHLGTRDATPEFILADPNWAVLGGIESNGGGLAVLWAEENSRDALFAAMRRREVYGTSGTRPIVRFFAGDYASDLCDTDDLVEQGYLRGVPMGAEVGAIRSTKSPTFAVLVLKDPGPSGMPLQRVQIVKGWVNSTGSTWEKVFEVAGDPENGATVDTDTCTPSGTGFDTLCTVWEDPEFHPSLRAFYYVRVLENPTCRWSTYLCNDQGVDCDANPPVVPAGLEECCNPDVPKTIQERAWSSPIWYRPESFGKFRARIKVKGGGKDGLKVKASLDKVPAELDPNTKAITVTLRDDDTIYSGTIPAGTMVERKPGAVWLLSDSAGTHDGIKRTMLRINAKGQGKFMIKTVRLPLPNADLVDHFVHTTLEAGTYKAEHARLWQAEGVSLKPQN